MMEIIAKKNLVGEEIKNVNRKRQGINKKKCINIAT